MGIISTVLIFWSLSGFLLRIIQIMKNTYLKGTNMFILRQINNKVNTMTVSMSVICLMLFMTITVLSSSLSLRGTMEKDLKDNTPVDLNLYKTANLPESFTKRDGSIVYYTSEQIEDSKLPISQTLKNNGLDMNKLKDVLEFYKYTVDNITLEEF